MNFFLGHVRMYSRAFLEHTKQSHALVFISLCLIALNAAIALLYIFYKPLNPDEFQHTHIVWNMFYNGKVIYRDFWEHHGVIYPVFNYFVFTLFDLDAAFTTFYVLRGMSYAGMFALFMLTYKIATAVFSSRTIGIASVAVLSSLLFFNLKVTEIRPDIIQNIFWLLGFYFLVVHFDKVHRGAFILSGIFFGLAILTNTKAVYGVFFVFAYLAGYFMFFPHCRRDVRTLCMWLVLGAASVFCIVLLYFASVGGLYKYIESNYLFNIIQITRDSIVSAFPYMWDIFVSHQLTFLIGCGMGLFMLCIRAFFNPNNKLIFFIVVTVGTASGALLGLFSQFYIMFFPFLAITAAYALTQCVTAVRRNTFLNTAVAVCVVAVFFIPQERSLLSELSAMRQEPNAMVEARFSKRFYSLQEQQAMVEYITARTDRSEPIGYFWNSCGIFTFNEDVQYYWSYERLHNDVFKALEGGDVFGEQYVQALEEKEVRYLSVTPQEWSDFTSSSTQQYIHTHYQYVSECLLERKEPVR